MRRVAALTAAVLLTAAALAAPASAAEPTLEDAAAQVGNGQVLALCNAETTHDDGLVHGANCTPIPVLPVAVSAYTNNGAGILASCPADEPQQNELLNLTAVCAPIIVT